jgi:predicted site-specific integrase-resolvase
MRVSFRTLNRWLADGKIKPSKTIEMRNGRTLWLWNEADTPKSREATSARVAIYARVSTTNHRQDVSLQTRDLDNLRKHAAGSLLTNTLTTV